MPQRAIIGINGDLLLFDETLNKLRTSGIGGSAVVWVPDADTRCEALNVTANGNYVAADAGKYGYDYVTVSVPGTEVRGTINGETYVVTVDEDRYLVYTKV